MHVKLPTTRSLLEVLVWSWIYTRVFVLGAHIPGCDLLGKYCGIQDSWSLRAPLPAICTLLSAFQNLSLSPGGECMAWHWNPIFVHLCWLKFSITTVHEIPCFFAASLASLVKSWLVASASGTGTCSDAKLKTRPKITCLAEIPRGTPWAMLPRPRWSHDVLASLLSYYPVDDLMVEVLSHGFLPLNLAAYLSEGWLAKVEGVETNPWVRFDPFCIWVREKKRYAGGETDLDTRNWPMSILHIICIVLYIIMLLLLVHRIWMLLNINHIL